MSITDELISEVQVRLRSYKEEKSRLMAAADRIKQLDVAIEEAEEALQTLLSKKEQ